jgi:hypothetical protein
MTGTATVRAARTRIRPLIGSLILNQVEEPCVKAMTALNRLPAMATKSNIFAASESRSTHSPFAVRLEPSLVTVTADDDSA